MGEGFGIVRRFERAEQAGAAAAAPDFRWIEHNAAFLALTQLVDPIDKPMGAGFPQDWTRACEIYGAILKSGEPKRFEVTLEPRDRVMEMYAFRLGGSDSDRIAVLFQDVTLRKRAEQRYKLLIHELNHRVRNNLAIVQALAAQTFRGTGCDAAVATFEGRLLALSAAHVALTAENWHGADILKILHGGLSAWIKTENPRIHIEGESLHVRPAAALALAMAVHELATNATKYGALATEQGAIDVRWSIVPGRRGDMLRWRWRERGGPAVVKPTRHGFGTWLIETGLARDLGGAVKLAFGAEGFTCTVEAPLAEISDFA
jgi:two-component system CheB/CheR fusion protein